MNNFLSYTVIFILIATAAKAQFYSKEIEKVDSLMNNSQYQKALGTINELLTNYPTDLQDSTYFRLKNIKGRCYYSLQRLDSAEIFLEKNLSAMEVHVGIINQEYLTALEILARIFDLQGKVEESKKYTKKAIKILLKIKKGGNKQHVRLLINLGVCNYNRGILDSALQDFNEALVIAKGLKDSIEIVNASNNLAIVARLYARYEESIEGYKSALAHLPSSYGKRTAIHATIYNNISSIYQNLGYNNECLFYEKEAYEIALESLNEDHELIPKILSNIGSTYTELGHYEKALINNEKALGLHLKYRSFDYQLTSQYYQSIGAIYLKKGDYHEAKIFFKKAHSILKEKESKHSSIETIYKSLSLAELAIENYTLAESYCRKAILFKSKQLGLNHPELAESYNIFSKIKRAVNQYDSSIYFLRKSISTNLKSTENRSLLSPIAYNELLSPKVFIQSCEELLNTLQMKQKDNLFSDQDELLFEFYADLVNKVIFRLRQDTYSRQDKVWISSNVRDLYQIIVEMYSAKKSISSRNTLEKVFQAFNNSKAIALTERIQVSRKYEDSHSLLFDSLNKVSKKLIAKRIYNNSKLESNRSNKDTLMVNNLEKELFDSERAYKSFMDRLRTTHKGFFELKYGIDANAIHLKEIQEQMDSDECILDFFESQSHYYLMAIRKNNVSFKKCMLSKAQLLEFKRKKQEGQPVYLQINQLVPEWDVISPGISKITVIPDGMIWNINFDLVLTKEYGSFNIKKLPYLIKECAIRYAYSSASLLIQNTPINQTKKQLLAFSYGEKDNIDGDQVSMNFLRDESVQLPGSRAEIRSIANLIEGDYFYGKSASERLFKKVAQDYQVLHLAVHAFIDDENPENSKLDFFSKSDSLEDGKLHAFELYEMKLNADMVVLSACNTGSGEIASGEGVMSLGRAFVSSGVNSMVLTRWQVSDNFTPQIIRTFYQELKKGKRKSEALRIAKLKFLENGDNITAKPFYWSAFYVLGNDSPIYFNKTNYLMKYGFILLMFLGGTILIFYFRINNMNTHLKNKRH